MANITPSHMMDRKLFPFTTIKPSGLPDAGGDKAFDADEEPCAPSAEAVVLQPVQPLVWQRPEAAGD
jgi:tRNA 2-thiocytidine biosynthesis protein TtcA